MTEGTSISAILTSESLTDGQIAALVEALHEDDQDEPTALLKFLQRELARRKRRGILQ
jgi:hypothetical protein